MTKNTDIVRNLGKDGIHKSIAWRILRELMQDKRILIICGHGIIVLEDSRREKVTNYDILKSEWGKRYENNIYDK